MGDLHHIHNFSHMFYLFIYLFNKLVLTCLYILLQTCKVEDEMRGEVTIEDGTDVAGVHYPM